MKLKKILLLLGLLSIALVKSSLAQSLPDPGKELVAAQQNLIIKQDQELRIKNTLIDSLQSNRRTLEARYIALDQKTQTEISGWKRRFEISEADRVRLQKERNQNRKFIAPGLGGAFGIGVLIGLLAGR